MSSIKRALIYYPWGRARLFLGIMLDEASTLIQDGYKVDFLICDGFLKNCFVNKLSSKSLCNQCVRNNELVLNNYNINVIRLSDFTSEPEQLSIKKEVSFSYANVNEIKALMYKECKIGYGALSSYVSYTRNQEPLISDEFKEYFDELLYSQVHLREAFHNLLAATNYNFVYTFNGRWADMRPLFDYCLFNKTEIRNIENKPIVEGKDYRKEVYINCLPQNVKNRSNWIEESWNKEENEKLKIEIGTAFFESRRSSNQVNNTKNFTSNQGKDKLPLNYERKKYNIVIFISSEDEFLALGEEWDLLSLFRSQEEGILFILNKIKDENIRMYVRIHPNLKDVNYGYHKRLYSLESKYSHVTIIAADSEVSTYALLDASDKIIVFGSTVGAEACYVDKPVVLLGGSLYYYLNVAYVPKNRAEVIPLILDKTLKPLPKLNALKYGYYFMKNSAFTTKIKNNPIPFTILGLTMSLFPHYKIIGSAFLGRFHLALLDIYYYVVNRFFTKSQFKNIPVDGH